MNREMVKILAYGHYAYINLQGTIDKEKMQTYVDGSLWLFDLLNKHGVLSDQQIIFLESTETQRKIRGYDV